MKAEDRTQYYREVSFEIRKPKWKHNSYFYAIYSNGHTYNHCSGTTGHMENHLKDYPNHTITWLEPEHDYDPKTYCKRISKPCDD